MSKCLDQTEIHGNQHMRYANRKVFAFVYSFHLIPPPALPSRPLIDGIPPDNVLIWPRVTASPQPPDRVWETPQMTASSQSLLNIVSFILFEQLFKTHKNNFRVATVKLLQIT